MNNNALEQIEKQIRSVRAVDSPVELRGAVLSEVRRELRAARRDRLLTRAAAMLLVVGVGINAALGLLPERSGASRFARLPGGSHPSFVETAAVIAEATDAATARQFAYRLALMRGRALRNEEVAAIEAAVRRKG